MMLGMSLSTFTTFHVVLSLIGIGTGLIVLAGMLAGQRLQGWTLIFLVTTIATSVTGFMFPGEGFDPARVVGVISLVALAAAVLALYGLHLAGLWRPTYVASAILALYLNVFVAVVQSFQKLPFLQKLAPTQAEPPFLVAQLVVLVVFLALGTFALRRFPGRRTQAA